MTNTKPADRKQTPVLVTPEQQQFLRDVEAEASYLRSQGYSEETIDRVVAFIFQRAMTVAADPTPTASATMSWLRRLMCRIRGGK
jgi:hypothetical protein